MGRAAAMACWARRLLLATSLCALTAAAASSDARAQALELGAQDNPHGLRPLGPIPSGGPLFQRHNGHLPYGLSDTSWSSNDQARHLSAEQLSILHEGMGATLARVPAFWPQIEPSPGTRRWTNYDELYRALIRRGVRPLWTLYQSPRHAVEPLRASRCRGAYCDDEPASGQLELLRRLARDLAARYPLSAAFEYRNEPNVSRDQAGPAIAPERYVAGLRAFHQGIKAGHADARVLGVALAVDAEHREYLAAVLRAGAASAMDGFSFHPYWTDARPNKLALTFSGIRDVLVAHGAGSVRLVPDEAGVSITPEKSGMVFDEAGQRDRMLAWFRLLDTADATVPLSSQVDAAVMFTTVDGGPGDGFGGYGWFTRRENGVLRPRPVFCAFREQIAGLPTFRATAPFGGCPGNYPGRDAKKSKTKRRKVLRSCPTKRSRTGKICRCRTVRIVVRGRRKPARRCGYVTPPKRTTGRRAAGRRPVD